MYYRISEFLEDWTNEVGKTTKMFSMITEEAKTIEVSDKVRSLGRLAFHIPQIISQIGQQTGLIPTPELPELPLPETMEDTLKLYLDYHSKMADAVKSQWTDDMLDGSVHLYRHEWRRGEVLSLLVHHEVHHRSQMTVIMRLVGLVVPNLYGPTREEWELMGIKPPL